MNEKSVPLFQQLAGGNPLTVMLHIRYPLSLRQVQDILFEREYIVLNNAAAEWKRPLREWTEAKTQFAVIFGERVLAQQRNRSPLKLPESPAANRYQYQVFYLRP
jgi:hypothetical protein